MSQQLASLKRLRDRCEFLRKKRRFFDGFYTLIQKWQGEPPNLLDIFRPEEIEYLLGRSIDFRVPGRTWNDRAKVVVGFVARSGYQDQPEVDEDGEPLLRRCTALHLAACQVNSDKEDNVRELFKIYSRFDANYVDEYSGYTHFHIACMFGCVDVVRKFLELGHVDPNFQTGFKLDAPLHMAKNAEVAELLLTSGANPDLANDRGETPLHIISHECKDIDIMQVLFKICDDKNLTLRINVRDNWGNTPLHLALHSRNVKAVEMLLRRGADPNIVDSDGRAPLHIICKNSYLYDEYSHDLLKMFFEICDDNQRTVEVDVKNEMGHTPLYLALERDSREVAEMLRRRGTGPNVVTAHGNEQESTLLRCIALYEKDDDLVKKLRAIFKNKPRAERVNVRDKRGNTPLYHALHKGFNEVAQFLLSKGADPNSANGCAWTPLHTLCAKKYDPGFVEDFFKRGELNRPMQVDARDKSGNTPLHLALSVDNRQAVESLLRRGADSSLANARGTTPLHIVCSRGNFDDDFVELFFEIGVEKHRPLRVDARDEKGCTPLHLAMDSGSKKAVELLLRNGSDPNQADEDGSTALHVFCRKKCDDGCIRISKTIVLHNDERVIELLLRNGADPNIADAKKRTALHLLCTRADDKDVLVKTLFEISEANHRKIDIEARDKDGNTPLILAIGFKNKKVSELLLRYGASPNSANARGTTPLHVVCRENFQDDFVRLFFEISEEKHRPLQINASNKYGQTPLHLAVRWGTRKAAELLLRRGADPNLADEDGSTALHLTCERRSQFYDFADLLFKTSGKVDKVIEVDAKDKSGRTPLQRAVANLRLNVVDVLLDNGADLSSFVFPAESYFGEGFRPCKDYNYKLMLASSALAVVERLEKRRYKLDLSEAVTIMKFFAKKGLFEKSADFEKCLRTDKHFEKRAKMIKIKSKLSLKNLIQLRPVEAAKLMKLSDFIKLAKSNKSWKLPESHEEACVVHLCEKMSRGFFRDCALESFMDLLRYKLSLDCCEMVIDESFTNEDLYNICLAAAGKS